MLDNLRDQASNSPFFQGDEPNDPELEPKPTPVRRSSGRFLGMTAVQRLIFSIFLLATVCVVGVLCLLVTERIWL